MAQGGKNPKGYENALLNDNLKDSEDKQEEEEPSVGRPSTQNFQPTSEGEENALLNDNLKDSEDKQEEEEPSVGRPSTQNFQPTSEGEGEENCRDENLQVRLSQSIRVHRDQEGNIFQETVHEKEELNRDIDTLDDMLHDESQNIEINEMRQLMRRIRHRSQLIQHMDKEVLEHVEILWEIVFG